MFSFSKKANPREGGPSVPELTTLPFPMGLEERKAFRREMLYQAIRQSMQSLEVNSSRYRFKVINVDNRHHRFLAMIEVTSNFEARKGGAPQSFNQIEALIKENAYSRFGIFLEGIFWRVSESEKAFASKSREGDASTDDASGPASQRQPLDASSTKEERLARQKLPKRTRHEHHESKNVLAKSDPSTMHYVEDTVYDSEPPAPDDKPMLDGDPFGPLN
jgi:hypothetical protein